MPKRFLRVRITGPRLVIQSPASLRNTAAPNYGSTDPVCTSTCKGNAQYKGLYTPDRQQINDMKFATDTLKLIYVRAWTKQVGGFGYKSSYRVSPPQRRVRTVLRPVPGVFSDVGGTG